MRPPTPDQMRTAASWLECNEGEDDEQASCYAVAAWLIAKADDTEFVAACREAGVPVAKARAAIKSGMLCKPD